MATRHRFILMTRKVCCTPLAVLLQTQELKSDNKEIALLKQMDLSLL